MNNYVSEAKHLKAKIAAAMRKENEYITVGAYYRAEAVASDRLKLQRRLIAVAEAAVQESIPFSNPTQVENRV